MNGGLFYLMMDCDTCGETIFMGPLATTMERGGLPVIPLHMAVPETFRCECCGAIADMDRAEQVTS